MKRFKISFPAIVAIITFASTATHADIFNKDKILQDVVDCYTNITYANTPQCSFAALMINVTACETAIAQLGKPVVNNTAPIDQGECGLGGSIFCCAKVAALTPAQCGRAIKIEEVFCKNPND